MYKQELNTAIWAANEAAKVIRKYAKEESFDIDVKGKNDLVTTADLASEKIILDMIKKEFADDQFLAEESSDYKELPDGRVWIIDPIDGTTNFSHGFYPYCVSIALWENGEPKVGIVLEVTRNELFWAVEGEGAYLLDEKITISKESDPAKALLSTGFPYNRFDLIDKYMYLLKNLMQKTHGIRRPGAASYDLCCVACGRVEGFFEYGLSPWDTAAGALIIKEAGGLVTDWMGGNEWLFGKRIIAGNTSVITFLQKEIAACFDENHLVFQK